MAGSNYFVSLICSVPSHLNISFSCLKWNEITREIAEYAFYLFNPSHFQSVTLYWAGESPACLQIPFDVVLLLPAANGLTYLNYFK